jgi:hypothetical protein
VRSITSESADPDAAYWTEQWLRYGGGGLDPLGERPVDYRARDRAEIAIARTPHLPAQGSVRTQIWARRASAMARSSELDDHLREVFELRRRLADRIERCSLALRGLGYQFDDRRGRYRGLPPLAWQDDQDDQDDERGLPSDESSSSGLTGAALRRRAEQILRVVEVPVTPAELVELLALEGVAVRGRPSHTLTNALRVSLARGDVERCGRGRYRWVPSRAVA